MTALVPLGDRGFLAEFADDQAAASWASAVSAENWPGVLDVVPAYHRVGVHADPERINLDELEGRLRGLIVSEFAHSEGRLIVIPTLYEGEDLQEVADQLSLDVGRVVEAHSSTAYRVRAIGFLPGFPYAGDLPACLSALPRRPSPRTRVPAGSVAIAGRQTAIYPGESPGGWHLIGRTPFRIVDLARGYFPIRIGDRLRFVPIGRDEFEARRGAFL